MRKLVAIVVAMVVAASCIPWLRHQRFFSALVAIIAVVLACLIVMGAVRALSKWRESRHGETQFGWLSPRLRNLFVGAAVFLLLMLTVPHFMATTGGAYKLAMTTANQTPQFTEALGTPIRESWFSEGRTEYGNPTRAELTIPVRGSKQGGDLRVVAIKVEKDWKLKILELELAQSGKRIDLLAGPR